MVVYIAGPFRATTAWGVEQNVRRAEQAALEVWRLGAAAVCPHMNTRHFHGVLADNVWLDGDIEILKRCDAVLMLDGWEESVGASAECGVAHSTNIPVFFDFAELKSFILAV